MKKEVYNTNIICSYSKVQQAKNSSEWEEWTIEKNSKKYKNVVDRYLKLKQQFIILSCQIRENIKLLQPLLPPILNYEKFYTIYKESTGKEWISSKEGIASCEINAIKDENFVNIISKYRLPKFDKISIETYDDSNDLLYMMLNSFPDIIKNFSFNKENFNLIKTKFYFKGIIKIACYTTQKLSLHSLIMTWKDFWEIISCAHKSKEIRINHCQIIVDSDFNFSNILNSKIGTLNLSYSKLTKKKCKNPLKLVENLLNSIIKSESLISSLTKLYLPSEPKADYTQLVLNQDLSSIIQNYNNH